MFKPELFSRRLKQARTDAGLSQTTLSERSGISRVIICDIETLSTVRRWRNPQMRTVVALADALGVSEAWLCGWADQALSQVTRVISSK